jgi:hypothetical protein
MPEETLLETLSNSFAQGLAMRISRRSTLGRLGRGAIAISLGGAGAALLAPGEAFASCSCCTTGNNSIRCQCLAGGSNACPSDTCQCGWWCVSDSTCSSGHKFWTDCCGGCNNGGLCTCITDCVDGTVRPSCCWTKEWGCGCGTVGSQFSHIKCRIHICGSCTPGTNC